MNSQKSFSSETPTLYVVATPIGNLQEMTPRAVETLKTVDIIACEDTRTSKPLLAHFDIHTKLIAHHLFNEKQSAEGIIELLSQGNNVGLISDAGYPLISDPGQWLVRQVIEAGYHVVTINGPTAMMCALVSSGLCPQPFTFIGFAGSSEKESRKTFETWKAHTATMIFYEAPHRIEKTLKVMLDVFGDRQACVARELTKLHEEYLRGNLSELVEACEGLKGEMVIVVEGYKQPEEAILSMDDLVGLVEQRIEQGMSAKEAIKQVAKENGVSKNTLYNTYQQHSLS